MQTGGASNDEEKGFGSSIQRRLCTEFAGRTPGGLFSSGGVFSTGSGSTLQFIWFTFRDVGTFLRHGRLAHRQSGLSRLRDRRSFPKIKERNTHHKVTSYNHRGVRVRFPAYSVAFRALTPSSHETRPDQHRGHTQPLTVRVSTRTASLGVAQVHSPVFHGQLGHQRHAGVLSLHIAGLPFHRVSPVRPAGQGAVLILMSCRRGQAHPGNVCCRFGMEL